MMRSLSLALACATFASPALSLSCMRPDAVRMFENARDSADVYYVIKGRVTPVGEYAVPIAENGKDGTTETPVQISGIGLNARGFSVPVDTSATVTLKCLSVWCASPPPADKDLLMIVKTEDDDLSLEVGPCGGTAIAWSAEAEERLLRCHLSDDCKPAEF